nr:hypothetical protein [Planctomycetota bacterium]
MHGTPGARAAAARLLGELRAQWDPTRGLLGAPGGEPATPGDCAQVIHGAITCYSAIGEVSALAFAVDLQDHLDHVAWREGTSRYGEGEGAAAATALAALDLVRLARITDDDAFAARAARIIDAHGPRSDSPIAELSAAIAEKEAPILHLTLIGGADEAGTAALLAAAHRRIVPGFSITVLDEGEASKALRRRFPGMPLMPRLPGKAPSAYLCTASACDPPTAEPAALARRIAELAKR